MRYDEHYVEWNEKQIARLWDYYAKAPSGHVNYFAKLCGREILKRCGVPLKERLDVLDFGSGPGFIWNHLQNLKAKWHYTALDFSSESIAQIEKMPRVPRNLAGHSMWENFPCRLIMSNLMLSCLLRLWSI